MSAAKFQRVVDAADSAARFLDDIGEHKRANDIRAIIKSNDGYRACLQQLHRDNLELRKELETTGGARG